MGNKLIPELTPGHSECIIYSVGTRVVLANNSDTQIFDVAGDMGTISESNVQFGVGDFKVRFDKDPNHETLTTVGAGKNLLILIPEDEIQGSTIASRQQLDDQLHIFIPNVIPLELLKKTEISGQHICNIIDA